MRSLRVYSCGQLGRLNNSCEKPLSECLEPAKDASLGLHPLTFSIRKYSSPTN